MTLTGRIELGVTPEEYYARKLGVANKSGLDLVRRSPAHYRCFAQGGASEESEAMAFGSAVHLAVLEPERFEREYVVQPDFGNLRTKIAKAARDEWVAANPGVQSLDPEDHARVLSVRDSVLAHPTAGPLLRGGHSEVTAYWVDLATGLECKARIDYWRPDLRTLIDVKTTEDASPEGFGKSVARYGYHRQAAWYGEGFRAAGEQVDAFIFVAVEKRPPYAVGVYVLDQDGIERGASSIRRDLETLAECMLFDSWPAYDEQIQTLSLPRWADA